MGFVNIADFKDPNDDEGRSYREVNNSKNHRFTVGQLVELESGARLFVAKQTRDCDGSLMYSLTPELDSDKYNWVHGYGEDSLYEV